MTHLFENRKKNIQKFEMETLTIKINHKGPKLSTRSTKKLQKLINNAVNKFLLEDAFIRNIKNEMENINYTKVDVDYRSESLDAELDLSPRIKVIEGFEVDNNNEVKNLSTKNSTESLQEDKVRPIKKSSEKFKNSLSSSSTLNLENILSPKSSTKNIKNHNKYLRNKYRNTFEDLDLEFFDVDVEDDNEHEMHGNDDYMYIYDLDPSYSSTTGWGYKKRLKRFEPEKNNYSYDYSHFTDRKDGLYGRNKNRFPY